MAQKLNQRRSEREGNAYSETDARLTRNTFRADRRDDKEWRPVLPRSWRRGRRPIRKR